MSKDRIESEDEALVLACRRGDAAAWETLIKRYQRLLYTIPRRFGLDDDGCADVFQRTFTALWQHLGRIEQPRHIRAWLVTTARREAGQLARHQRKMSPLDSLDSAEAEGAPREIVDPAPPPESLFLQMEEQQIVRMLVESLDERCAQLLTLLFYRPDSAPYAEIAAKLGIPEGSIGPTRARCLQKLRRLLEGATF
jgi:RNA polymerase sigma factor (sigma-70 family)